MSQQSATISTPSGVSKSDDNGIIATVAVLLPLPVDDVDGNGYDYAVPEDSYLAPGDFVEVPLSGRKVYGVVWGPGKGQVARHKLRAVLRKLPAPPMMEPARRLVDFISGYYLVSKGVALKLFMPVPEALEAAVPEKFYKLAANPPKFRVTSDRQKLLDLFQDQERLAPKHLKEWGGITDSVVKSLIKLGVIELTFQNAAPSTINRFTDGMPTILSAQQQEAASCLREAVRQQAFQTFLLDGVTGSGKTEVYFEALAEAFAGDGQVLVLLPEIALTNQWLDRFKARFGQLPDVWHSEISRAKKRELWRKIASGQSRVVVGARSALFLPFPDLSLIVVDEEHDNSFKQDDGICYHGRDLAVARASFTTCPVVLSSATPSLETWANVERGRYRHLQLPHRFAGAELPQIAAIDLRQETLDHGIWLAPSLVSAINETLSRQEQVLLFLNRRGYAPLTLCRSCGHRLSCPQCAAWLVEHRLLGKLMCHHCGYQAPPPMVCEGCGAEGKFAVCGPGVERIAEEVQLRWPNARKTIIASDTIGGPEEAAQLFQQIEAGAVDILIGTQILAKGHHFPNLTLVGVIDGDLGLGGGDLRAGERCFQLLSQVAGRAGRAQKPGKVLVQTHRPEDPVMQALIGQNRDQFVKLELSQRKAALMPPFARLAGIVISGPDESEVIKTAQHFARLAPRVDGLEILGPAPAPIGLLRGKFRWRLLACAEPSLKLQPILKRWRMSLSLPNNQRIQIDIDPYSFL